MATVNMSSILAKVKAYTNSDSFRKKVEQNPLGGIEDEVCAAADKFIDVMKSEISASGATISDAVSMGHGNPKKTGRSGNKYKYEIDVSFTNNKSRPSLQPEKYPGAYDIIAIFNNGYSAGGQVFGFWHGAEVGSLAERPGLHFIESAVRNFDGNFAKTYGVTKVETLNPDYK